MPDIDANGFFFKLYLFYFLLVKRSIGSRLAKNNLYQLTTIIDSV